jgi:hypothetical protein
MDLSTQYLGLLLRSPLVVSASPLSSEVGHTRKMEDAGAGATVLYSFFEKHTTACRANYEFCSLAGPEAYMDHIVDAKRSVGTPSSASKTSELSDTVQTRAERGTNRTNSSGSAASTANVPPLIRIIGIGLGAGGNGFIGSH